MTNFLRPKVWVEINRSTLADNIAYFRNLLDSPSIGSKSKLWAVVKSNAYGHGLVTFSKLADELGVDGFCLDSVIEGLRLRREGIKKSVLVLGPTLPYLLEEAQKNDLTITVSSEDGLRSLLEMKKSPYFHLKIDSGMRRQGFYVEDLGQAIALIKNSILRDKLIGVYTHFASAKDINYPTFTDRQLEEFKRAVELLEAAGFNSLIKHAAATGGSLIGKKYHLDAVRIGIGLYGWWPSRELEVQLSHKAGGLKPVLAWKTIVSEIKMVKEGDFIGYDLTDRIIKDGKIAILPIGYWHGLPRSLSNGGEVLVNGKRVIILGKVMMDMVVVDVSDIDCQCGNEATIIGQDGQSFMDAGDQARRAGTIHYELITRINPLIKRIII